MYPHIMDEMIAFVAEDDLWLIKEGSIPQRITTNFGIVRYPKISPDKKWIAFNVLLPNSGSEIYIINITGGVPQRLTYLESASTKLVAWSEDSKYIIFASDYGRPFKRWSELFKVSVSGGEPERQKYGVANDIIIHSKFILLGRHLADSARWKRYRGGTAGRFWISRNNAKFVPFLSDINGNLTNPMFVKHRFYFVSDHEGIGKLYSCTESGADLMAHTDNKDYYVRNASTDGKKIVYQMAGDIYLYDPASKDNRKVEISINSSKTQISPRFLEEPLKFLECMDISGDSILFDIRGKIYNMRYWEGPIFIKDNIRYRSPKYIDDHTFCAIYDGSGAEELVIFGDMEKHIKLDAGLINNLAVSPARDKIILANNRLDLILADLKTGETKIIDHALNGTFKDITFSADGKYIAYSISNSVNKTNLRIRDLEGMDFKDITSTYRFDYSPAFDPDGRFLYFISLTGFSPVEDMVQFELSFPLAANIYLITLSDHTKSPFLETLPDSSTNKGIDFKGLENRIVKFPIPDGNYKKLLAIKDGILYMSVPIKGKIADAMSTVPCNGDLHIYKLKERKDEILVRDIEDFVISLDLKRLAYKSSKGVRVVNIADKIEDKGEIPGPESGYIDMKRIKPLIEPEKEFKQMLREAWRLMKENYWTSSSKIAWDRIYEKYDSLLSKVTTRAELSDLIWELQGELGTSHAYELGGDYSTLKTEKIGFLGAEFKFDGEGYVITKINEGRLDQVSPLRAPGLNVNAGDKIIAINGISLSSELCPNRVLINYANEPVSIAIQSGGSVTNVTVKTLDNPTPLLYREWVEKNKKYVSEKSGDKVGYVHIPDMGYTGYAEFHRSYFEEYSKKALIVDIRYNSGGFVSSLILEKLNRKVIGFDEPRHGLHTSYPNEAVQGPIVGITNEDAGSDGDIFSHAFKLFKLGPLIGKRTWGGVIGINPKRLLIDGTVVTQPEFAFWFKDVKFNVENYGTEPTIDIDITPDDYMNNIDAQLDKAIETALKLLKKPNN
ncbi:MAG: S41 family peptidase [Thermoplasmata archaeon]